MRQGELQEGRGWLAAWWLSCIIITTAYTTNLIAFLTVPVYPSRLETVAELALSPYRYVDGQFFSKCPPTTSLS